MRILIAILMVALFAGKARARPLTVGPKKVSYTGLNMIKQFEGFRPNVYLDVGGNPHIGYGHLLKPGENFKTVTNDEATILLKGDITQAENTVNSLVEVPITQNQFDALVSFVYNIGGGAFSNSTLIKRLNESDYDGAVKEFDRWVYATKDGQKIVLDNLVNRRWKEMQLFGG